MEALEELEEELLDDRADDEELDVEELVCADELLDDELLELDMLPPRMPATARRAPQKAQRKNRSDGLPPAIYRRPPIHANQFGQNFFWGPATPATQQGLGVPAGDRR